MGALGNEEYRRLLSFRTGLRRFLRWSAEMAEQVGVTPAHHQLMLAIRGHSDERGPTLGDVASYLLLKHHSAVELANRAEAAGLVVRSHDEDDHRVVRLALTDRGRRSLEQLTELHVGELERVVPDIAQLWENIPSEPAAL
jgi:DNA-binding MarR family transcriptional regulator